MTWLHFQFFLLLFRVRDVNPKLDWQNVASHSLSVRRNRSWLWGIRVFPDSGRLCRTHGNNFLRQNTGHNPKTELPLIHRHEVFWFFAVHWVYVGDKHEIVRIKIAIASEFSYILHYPSMFFHFLKSFGVFDFPLQCFGTCEAHCQDGEAEAGHEVFGVLFATVAYVRWQGKIS